MTGNHADQLFAGGQIHRLRRKRTGAKNKNRTHNRKQGLRIHGKTLAKQACIVHDNSVLFV
jgi:hypothetical protein